jgi:hypothetical protein
VSLVRRFQMHLDIGGTRSSEINADYRGIGDTEILRKKVIAAVQEVTRQNQGM